MVFISFFHKINSKIMRALPQKNVLMTLLEVHRGKENEYLVVH